jgi:tetratricopeptide (TPR) repeat protein
VLRHQGRDLETALALFAEAARLADDTDELFPKAYSITGASGIKVLAGVVPDDEEQLLADVEHEVAADSAHDGYMLEVWKTQAQLAWLRGNRQVAIDLVDAATERALARNDRLLYNLYFERAEYYRFDGAHAAALENYRRVLEFGNGNGDRNLISNALLGVVLVELSAGRWLFHETRDKARASVLSARQTAIEADIRITGGLAEAVSSMLDDSVPTPDSIRLIVL